MALYTKPPEVERIAGSRKGATFTRTPNGFIIRKRYMPKSSRNAKTTRNRARFLASVQNYRSLSAGGKFTFQNQAPNFQRVNSLGESYSLSTIQLASSQSYNWLENDGELPSLASSPVVFTEFSLAGSGWATDPSFLQILPNPNTVPLNEDLIIWLSPAGDWVIGSIPSGHMRQVLTVPSGHTGLIDLLPAYRETFGEERWRIGQTMIVGLQAYALFSGQKSAINYALIGLAS